MPASVFISYCGKRGLEDALALQKTLGQDGHSAFVAKEDIRSGSFGWSLIGKEVVSRAITVVITTECTYDSYSQALEYNLAINQKKPIFALVLDNSTIPEILLAPNYERFTNHDFETKASVISKNLDMMIQKHNEIFNKTPTSGFTPPKAEPVMQPDELYKGLNVEIVRKYEQTMVNAYLNAAIIRNICSIKEFDKYDERKPFLQIPVKTRVPAEWFTEEDYAKTDSSMVFGQFGHDVALGERNFFREQLLSQIKNKIRVASADVRFSLIQQHALEIRGKELFPSVLLAPIDYFTQMAKWYDEDRKAPCIKWEAGSQTLIINGEISLKIHWSNKYSPLQEFIIMDANSGLWTVKPDPQTGRAVTARIGRSRLFPDQVEVLCKTVANYTIKNAEGIRVIVPQ